MIKLFVFDLDGVLIDSKDLHYQALNLAIARVNPEWSIPYEDHLMLYNGNPTKVKLDILSKKYLDISELDKKEIAEKKQEITEILLDSIKIDEDLVSLFSNLSKDGYKIAVASNSVRDTVKTVLNKIGVYEIVDLILSNEDVKDPKPSPEIYNSCMKHFNVTPEQTVVFEDSEIGLAAAGASGAKVVLVSNRKSLNKELVESVIK